LKQENFPGQRTLTCLGLKGSAAAAAAAAAL